MPKTGIHHKDENSKLTQAKNSIHDQQTDNIRWPVLLRNYLFKILFCEIVDKRCEVELVHQVLKHIPENNVRPCHEAYVNCVENKVHERQRKISISMTSCQLKLRRIRMRICMTNSKISQMMSATERIISMIWLYVWGDT